MTIAAHPQESVPRWLITFDDLTQVLTAAGPRLERFPNSAFPMIFSCSSDGIWPTTRLGPIPSEERQYVDGQSNVIDAVAHVMLCHSDSPGGGRFSITLDGATRTRDGVPIAEFELAP